MFVWHLVVRRIFKRKKEKIKNSHEIEEKKHAQELKKKTRNIMEIVTDTEP